VAGSARAQQLVVDADAYQHQFDGAGVSIGLFLGHHYSMPPDDQDRAVRWINEDLNTTYLQEYNGRNDLGIYPEGNDQYFDRRADYVLAARAIRPDLEFSLVFNMFPDNLRTDVEVDGMTYRVLDVDRPGIYAELADWYFQTFRAFDERGVTVDILNAVNEPDLEVCGANPNQCRTHHYGYDGDTRRGVAEIFAQAVPLFKAMLADPEVNTTGMPMPRVMGPSAFGPNGAIDYVRYFKQDFPAAWDQIDIVATHQYVDGVRGDLFQTLRAEAEGKPIHQSETHGSKQFGDPSLRANHRTALSLSQLMGAALNFGTSAWYYFQTNYPNLPDPDDPSVFNPGGLLSVPFNTTDPVRYKHYFAFRQLTSAQPDSSFVLDYAASSGRRADVLAFRKPGEDTVYVNVTNTSGDARAVTIEVEDADGGRGVLAYTVRTTDADRDDETIAEVDVDGEDREVTFEIGPYSINTFTIALGGTLPVASEPATGAVADALLPNWPNPFRAQTEIGYRLGAPGPVELAVYDVLGREVATLVDGVQPAGAYRVPFVGSGLAAGVYVYTLTTEAGRVSRRMVVAR
jgi:hypothetical protein